MEIFMLLLFIIYLISVFVLSGCYGEYNISPNIWSIIILFIPIINTGLICYFLFKNKREQVNKFFSIKEFFNDIKNN